MGRRGEVRTLEAHPGLIGGQLRLDEWRGVERVQFMLERLREAGSFSAALDVCEETSPEEPVASVPGGHTPPPERPRVGNRVSAGDWPPPSRDLRDQPGRLSALAQVLATGEVTLVLTCSVPHAVARLGERIPLDVLAGDGLVCVDCGSLDKVGGRLGSGRVIISEWDTAPLIGDSLPTPAHAIAVDPPFRTGHLSFFESLGEAGSSLHLLYGEGERAKCAELLRNVVHPRFAMVCLYRAMQTGTADESQLLAKAAALAREERGVTLRISDLERAYGILCELGLERPTSGKAKLEAGSTAAYREAEAEYEECLGLCLTL
jgi:hypothetical protein